MKAIPTASCTALTAPASPAGRTLVASSRPVNLRHIIRVIDLHFESCIAHDNRNLLINLRMRAGIMHVCSYFFSLTGLRRRFRSSSILKQSNGY